MLADTMAQLELVVRLTLGFIFMVSAVAKLRHPVAFVRGVLEYQVLPSPLAHTYGWLLPYAEFATSLLLLSGIAPVLSAALAAFLLLNFNVALITVLIHRRDVNCSCFSVAQHTERVGWYTFLRDMLLNISTLWLLVFSIKHSHETIAILLPTLLPAAVLALFIGASYILLADAVDVIEGLSRYHVAKVADYRAKGSK